MAENKNKRKYHRPEQVVEKLRQADRLLNAGQSVAQVIQTLGGSTGGARGDTRIPST